MNHNLLNQLAAQPDNPNPVQQFRITDLATDAQQILKMMGLVTQAYIRSPFIREYAVGLLDGLGNNDIPGQANRMISFVKDNVIYVRDPVGSEYLQSPAKMLTDFMENGRMMGDCDDHVMLLNTLLGAVGIPAKAVAVKMKQSPVYNHVISGIEMKGQVYFVDPCVKGVAQPVYRQYLFL